MSVKKTVIGAGFAIAMLVHSALGALPPQVFLTVRDTVLYPGDPEGRNLTIRLNNPAVKVGAYSVSLTISEPDIINFPYTKIDTVLPHWRYFTDCTPPPCHSDSVYECPDSCFNYTTKVETLSTRSSGFANIQGRRLSEIVLQVTGLASTFGDPGPALQPGNGVLFRVPLNIFPISDTFSLSQRQVEIYFDSIYTNVSDSTGNTTWRTSDGTLAITHGTVTVPYSIKGDCNFDGLHNPQDIVRLLTWVFQGSSPPLPSPSVGDVNCDGTEDPSDIVILLRKVFVDDPLPCN